MVYSNMQTCAIVDENDYGGVDVVQIGIEQEPGSGGKESALNAKKFLQGHRVETYPPATNKQARAQPFAATMAWGKVYVVKDFWTGDYVEELRKFSPDAKYVDQVDASSGGHQVCFGSWQRKKVAYVTGVSKNPECRTKGCTRKARTDDLYCCPGCQIADEMELAEVDAQHSATCNADNPQQAVKRAG